MIEVELCDKLVPRDSCAVLPSAEEIERKRFPENILIQINVYFQLFLLRDCQKNITHFRGTASCSAYNINNNTHNVDINT